MEERDDFMGMTMSQKILAHHAGLDHVEAGQLIECKLDLVLGNDITAPVAIGVFEALRQTGFPHLKAQGKMIDW